MLRWFWIAVTLFFCSLGALGLRIQMERSQPNHANFETLWQWANRPYLDSLGLEPTSGLLRSGFLTYGFDLRQEALVKNETRRRLLLLESQIHKQEELYQWLRGLASVSTKGQMDELKSRPGLHHDEVLLSLLVIDCESLLSAGQEMAAKSKIRDGLAKLFRSKKLQVSSDFRSLDCVVLYFSMCQKRGDLAQAYDEMIALAPHDQAWVKMVRSYLLGTVDRAVYRHRLAQTILQQSRQHPHSQRANP